MLPFLLFVNFVITFFIGLTGMTKKVEKIKIDLDLKLAKDFRNKYRTFIEETTSKIPPETTLGYREVFKGWINNLHVVIGRTHYGQDGKTNKDSAVFCFGNIEQRINKPVFLMPIKYRTSDKHKKKYYYFFKVQDFKNALPEEFVKILLCEREMTSAKDENFTTFHRLVASCRYRITYPLFKIEIHHIDKTLNENDIPLNDHIDNLVPMWKESHLESCHNYDSLKELLNKNKNSGLSEEEIIEIYKVGIIDFSKKYAEAHFIVKEPERNYADTYNDENLFICYYLKYIEGLKSGYDNVEIKGVKLPCDKTIREYLKMNEFMEFKRYYTYITS